MGSPSRGMSEDVVGMEHEEDQIENRAKASRLLPIFEVAVVVPTLVGLTVSNVHNRGELSETEFIELAVWILIIALVELVPVPVWRGVHISMGFPLMMVVAFLYPPDAA